MFQNSERTTASWVPRATYAISPFGGQKISSLFLGVSLD
ncbi:rCG35053 [Rattus norvegicus]|uniref:RCG35053 n=1 Tax=Rattus norvegicus TaxID=10116 RepID=A6HHR3_RAT|nr:rCG35053 [Rattus norvegicus]